MSKGVVPLWDSLQVANCPESSCPRVVVLGVVVHVCSWPGLVGLEPSISRQIVISWFIYSSMNHTAFRILKTRDGTSKGCAATTLQLITFARDSQKSNPEGYHWLTWLKIRSVLARPCSYVTGQDRTPLPNITSVICQAVIAPPAYIN